MFLYKKNNLLRILFLTIIFSFLIFITKNYFFGGKEDFQNTIIEEKYIEPVVIQDEINEELNKKIEEKLLKNMTPINKFKYTYIPSNFSNNLSIKPYFSSLDTFLKSNFIEQKISLLSVFLHEKKGDVRGKMKDKKLNLFGVLNMEIYEFLAVSIHEFSHYYDLYILEKKVSLDISEYFYYISWENTTTIKSGLEQKDFVSGYAMTNKYEDFSESFTYYVLHNSDFSKKSEKSELLKEKYDFFSKFIFRNDEFKTNNFKVSSEIKDYYRDITKIEFSLENFLQYLKK